jgi:hypothetical protein
MLFWHIHNILLGAWVWLSLPYYSYYCIASSRCNSLECMYIIYKYVRKLRKYGYTYGHVPKGILSSKLSSKNAVLIFWNYVCVTMDPRIGISKPTDFHRKMSIVFSDSRGDGFDSKN